MRIGAMHSHLGGLEFLAIHWPELMPAIERLVSSKRDANVVPLGAAVRRTARHTVGAVRAKRIAVSARAGARRAERIARCRRDIIDVGIEILPMKSLQERMSSGPGYYEAELYNLIREGRGVPAVPLVLIGVEP